MTHTKNPADVHGSCVEFYVWASTAATKSFGMPAEETMASPRCMQKAIACKLAPQLHHQLSPHGEVLANVEDKPHCQTGTSGLHSNESRIYTTVLRILSKLVSFMLLEVF